MQRNKGTEVRARNRPPAPRTRPRPPCARRAHPPPSSESSAPPSWLISSSTCGVFTHVTSEPGPRYPSLRLCSRPSLDPAPHPLRLRNIEQTQRAARTEQKVGGSLLGQAGHRASAWLQRVARGGGAGRTGAEPSRSTGFLVGSEWAGLKRAGRGAGASGPVCFQTCFSNVGWYALAL